MQRVRTAKLQTVIDASRLRPADPDERRTRGTHSLAEDADLRLLNVFGYTPRRSQPLLINAGFHTAEVSSDRQAKRLTPVQHSPAHTGILCGNH